MQGNWMMLQSLPKMHSELNDENKTLQKKDEQLSLHAGPAKGESLGMREHQGKLTT